MYSMSYVPTYLPTHVEGGVPTLNVNKPFWRGGAVL